MDKNDFRSLYASVAVGGQLSVVTIARSASYLGTISKMYKGRGRGGSLSIVLDLGDGNELVLSSTKSHELQFASAECSAGQYVSFGNFNSPVVNYNVKANPDSALAVKLVFEKVLADVNRHGPRMQTIVLNAPGNEQLHGKWSVRSARVLRGRNGQVALTLSQEPHVETVEVWSRRVASVITGARAMLASGEVLDYGSVEGLPQ